MASFMSQLADAMGRRRTDDATGGGLNVLTSDELSEVAGGQCCEFIVTHTQHQQTPSHYRNLATGYFQCEQACIDE
jgi:hypothetical protein